MAHKCARFGNGSDAADEADVPFFIVDTTGEYPGERVTNESFSSPGIRGRFADLMRTVKSSMTEMRVRVRRLDTILRELKIAVASVDILSVEVEGGEIEVLAGLGVSKKGPRVLIMENVFNERRYVAAISARGYLLWRRIEPNDIYARKDLLA